MRYAYAPQAEQYQGRPERGRRRAHHPDGHGLHDAHNHDAHNHEGRGIHEGRRGRGPGARGRGRAQRGDVRAAVLMLLNEQPMHGYQLMQAIVDRTGGAWRPSPGAIYPTIAQLEDEGLVTVVADAGRKLVTLTDAGREFLSANQAALGDPFSAVQAGPNSDLRGAIEQLFAAARAVGQSGSNAQITAAREILDRARRELYLMLAEASPQSTE